MLSQGNYHTDLLKAVVFARSWSTYGQKGGRMTDLNTIYDLVKDILVIDTRARDDDMYLYVQFCKQRDCKEALKMPFYVVMEHSSEFGMPSYESVSRARRKVQSECPELRASEETKAARQEYEQMYLEWARG